MINDIIEYFGGVQATADVFTPPISRQSVHKWIINNSIPPKRAVQIEELSGGKFKAVDILKIGFSEDEENLR